MNNSRNRSPLRIFQYLHISATFEQNQFRYPVGNEKTHRRDTVFQVCAYSRQAGSEPTMWSITAPEYGYGSTIFAHIFQKFDASSTSRVV